MAKPRKSSAPKPRGKTGDVKLGASIRARRQDQGLRLTDFGPAISKSLMSQYESGTTMPPLGALQLIAERLGCTVDELSAASRKVPASAGALGSPDALTPEALHLARTWMQLSPARRAAFHEEIMWAEFFERKIPFYRIGRPGGRSYDQFERGVENEWGVLIRQGKLPLEGDL